MWHPKRYSTRSTPSRSEDRPKFSSVPRSKVAGNISAEAGDGNEIASACGERTEAVGVGQRA
jgi:hypothetical protein